MSLPDLQSVVEAYRRVRSHVKRTQVVEFAWLNSKLQSQIFFKCENEQHTGSFKIRGATNAMLQLEEGVDSVLTHSSGNHGAAVAYIAQKLGKRAFVVIPKDTTLRKRKNMLRYDAQLIECDPSVASRELEAESFLQSNNAKFIHPFDNKEILCGQGTATFELLQQITEEKDVEQLEQIWVPVGGGGLASGAVLAANGNVEIICAEPENVNDAYLSMQLGIRQPPTNQPTIADGLKAGIGKLNFEILHAAKVRVVLATEEEIKLAARWFWESLKMAVEPASAVVLAAMLKNPHLVKGRVGVILSGGNVSPF